MDAVNLAEFKELARRDMEPMAFDYYAGGSDDEVTLRENRAVWERLALRYRVLTEVGERDLATTVLGAPALCGCSKLDEISEDLILRMTG